MQSSEPHCSMHSRRDCGGTVLGRGLRIMPFHDSPVTQRNRRSTAACTSKVGVLAEVLAAQRYLKRRGCTVSSVTTPHNHPHPHRSHLREKVHSENGEDEHEQEQERADVHQGRQRRRERREQLAQPLRLQCVGGEGGGCGCRVRGVGARRWRREAYAWRTSRSSRPTRKMRSTRRIVGLKSTWRSADLVRVAREARRL